jgi:Ca2+-binding RTX toxin-like protein
MAIQTIQNTFLGSVAIPDYDLVIGNPGRITNTIAVTGHVPTGVVPTLEIVFLSILHTYDNDLAVTLTNPSGTTVALFSNVGGTDAGLINVKLSDAAATDIGTVDNPLDEADTGTFNLQGAALLSRLATGNMTGNWTLRVSDEGQGDTGTLLSWGVRLSFNYNGIVTGTAAADTLGGSDIADKMIGLNGADKMNGFAGNDRLEGGAGVDFLTGGPGSDTFVFNTTPNAATNRDLIIDYLHGVDHLQLENALFTKLGAQAGIHALTPAYFHLGATAADANDYLVYNQTTGILYYDANGNVAGGAIPIAAFSNHTVLSAGDFVVI